MITSPGAEALAITDPVYGLSDDGDLFTFSLDAPSVRETSVEVTGVGADPIVGMDFRPADGQLYAVTDGTTDDRIVRIDPETGVATPVSTLSVDLVGTNFGVDFNPVVDRLRIVSDTTQNLRVNVGTGVVATDIASTGDTALEFPTGDINAAATPSVVAVAYTNPVGGAASTQLFGMDSGTDDLVTFAGNPNAGQLTTVPTAGNAITVDLDVNLGLDIASDGKALAAVQLAGATSSTLRVFDTATGAFNGGATIGGSEVVVDLAIPIPTQAPVWGLTEDATSDRIVTMAGFGVGRVASNVAVTGLAAGDDLVAIDARPANGKLYGLGLNKRIYVLDPTSGVAQPVGTAPFGTGTLTYPGFDFNPVVDAIRITDIDGTNLRVNANTGSLLGTDGALSFGAGDDADIVASAYTNNVDGATTTVLHGLDSTSDDLVTQVPATGVLTTVGTTTGVAFGFGVGFDIGADGAAVAVNEVGAGNAQLYDVDLTAGTASFAGQLPTAVEDIAVKLPQPTGDGYVLAALDGGIFNYGTAPFVGSAGSENLAEPVIGIATRTTRNGYWLVATDGGVFAYGDSKFYGSTGGMTLNEPVVGIAAHPSNKGYWMVAEDGGVFAFGESKFFGSTGGMDLNEPIVAMASTSTGLGYWLFAADGGVFAYGDAVSYGSMGGTPLNEPVVGGAAAQDGLGYYLVAADGGIFAFGPGAPFLGSTGDIDLNDPIFGIATDLDGRGYTMVALDGGVFNFESTFHGSKGGEDLNAPVIGIAGV